MIGASPLRAAAILALGLATTACQTRQETLPEPPPPPRAIVFHDADRARRAGAVTEYLRDAGFKVRSERAELVAEPSRRVLIYSREAIADLEQQVRASLRDFDDLQFQSYPHAGPEDFQVVVWLIGPEHPALAPPEDDGAE